ncbi:MAG: trimeric intracellular cation channel family protein [Clostridia bacterium]|nr:trimeric intracellular cation channel family protein [Clostridia bacterium]
MPISDLIYFIFEIIGTVAFAVSGAMVAIKKKVDIFGVLVLSSATALGGGMIRDIIIGYLPPRMFSDYRYVLAALISALVVFITAFIFRKWYQKSAAVVDSINNIFDAIGLGIFTVTGAKVAIESGFTQNGILVVCLGVLTGVGGGLLRDVMLCEIPFVLKKRIYAIASILGGVLYHILITYSVEVRIATIASVVLVFVIRILATVLKLDLPRVKLEEN